MAQEQDSSNLTTPLDYIQGPAVQRWGGPPPPDDWTTGAAHLPTRPWWQRLDEGSHWGMAPPPPIDTTPRWWQTMKEDPWYVTGAKTVFGEQEVEKMRSGDKAAWAEAIAPFLLMGKGPKGMRMPEGAVPRLPPPRDLTWPSYRPAGGPVRSMEPTDQQINEMVFGKPNEWWRSSYNPRAPGFNAHPDAPLTPEERAGIFGDITGQTGPLSEMGTGYSGKEYGIEPPDFEGMYPGVKWNPDTGRWELPGRGALGPLEGEPPPAEPGRAYGSGIIDNETYLRYEAYSHGGGDMSLEEWIKNPKPPPYVSGNMMGKSDEMDAILSGGEIPGWPAGASDWADPAYLNPNVKLPRGTHAGPLPPNLDPNAPGNTGTEGWYDPRTGKLMPGNKELLQKYQQQYGEPPPTPEKDYITQYFEYVDKYGEQPPSGAADPKYLKNIYDENGNLTEKGAKYIKAYNDYLASGEKPSLDLNLTPPKGTFPLDIAGNPAKGPLQTGPPNKFITEPEYPRPAGTPGPYYPATGLRFTLDDALLAKEATLKSLVPHPDQAIITARQMAERAGYDMDADQYGRFLDSIIEGYKSSYGPEAKKAGWEEFFNKGESSENGNGGPQPEQPRNY